jgi:hypothetical protein
MHVSRHYIYRRWIQEPVIWTYTDGYWDIDGYPYYVDDGYRYRYNPVETCRYDLVDGNDYTAVQTFEDACNVAYDNCAILMEQMNQQINSDRYFCAEPVDDDLVVDDTTEYNPLPTDITAQRQAAIESFLQGKTFIDLYKAGRDGVGKCKIEKKGLFASCKYMVKVEGKPFPDPTGYICSSAEKAELVGCKEPNQKGNAGCILEKAVLQGYCIE